MTTARSLGLVAGRELREAMRRRTFWIVVAVSLVGSAAAMVIPELIDDDSDRYEVVVVDGSPTLEAVLEAAADNQDVALDVREVDDRAAAERGPGAR